MIKKQTIGELSMIEEIRRRALRISSPDVTLGIGDDCALVRVRAGEEIAVTTDLTLENVHFRRDWHPAESVGHRCLARGLSDLAAMGARPVGALLSIGLPPELIAPVGQEASWLARFLDGFLALAALHKVPLIGGDTAQSPISPGGKSGLVTADVILVGAVKRGRALRRSGAKTGDLIYVTGALGGAAAEFLALKQNPYAFRAVTKSTQPEIHPHLYPAPRIAVGRRLLGSATASLATAAIDLSDGLSTDLRHICDESGLAAEIYNLPLHPLAQAAEAAGLAPSTRTVPHDVALGLALGLAITGGEDYELLFTASPQTKIPARIAGVPIHAIGEMKPQRRGRPVIQMRLERPPSRRGRRGSTTLVPVERGGWEHFRPS